MKRFLALYSTKLLVISVLLFVALFGHAMIACAAGDKEQDDWKFSITPYLWLPNIDATFKYGIPAGATGSPEVQAGPNDYFASLDFAMMLSGEVRKNRWSVFTDIIYLDIASEKSSVKSVNFGGNVVTSSANISVDSSVKGGAWTLGTGYAVLPGRPVTLDVFGGFRYFSLEASADWDLAVTVTGPNAGQTFPRSGSITKREDFWDGIIGVKGRFWLGNSNWSIPYYLDVGTGSSNLTWQGMLGVAYSFKWGDVTCAYRNLYYEGKGDSLIQDLRFTGPLLGATFRF
jgi:hypothetical protein